VPIRCETEDGRAVELTDRVAIGAQGAVYRVAGSALLAKVLLALDDREQARRRIRLLIAHGREPRAAALAGGQPPRTAWPLAALSAGRDSLPGFLMVDLAPDRMPLEGYLSPAARSAAFPAATWLEALRAALSLAHLVADMHAASYVVGDLKAENLWIDAAGRIALCDVDSVQFSAAGEIFGCTVGSPGYAAPELIDKPGRLPDPDSDAFALAVLIYRLLVGGVHPFHGVPRDGSPYLGLNDNILHGRARLLGPAAVRVRPDTPLPALLPRALRDLFRRCFDEDGRAAPARRPGPAQWIAALGDAAQPGRIRQCAAAASHVFPIESPWCPWCDAARHGVECYPTR
jgi:DNA-binding helix-hairpin-helix protein with protein kinase domain